MPNSHRRCRREKKYRVLCRRAVNVNVNVNVVYKFMNQSVTGAPYSIKSYSLSHGRQEGHPACKKQSGMVICLERGADLHMAQLMPLPLTVSCSSKIQIGFTFLVPASPGCPGKEAVKWL